MRILNVTQSYEPFFEFGGPPAKVRALSEGLARMGHDVTVLTADWGFVKRVAADQQAGVSPAAATVETSPFGQRRKANGVTAIYLANWLHYRAVSWNPALGRYLRARLNEFDVVHIFGLYDFLGKRVGQECRARGIPYVVEPIGMFVPIVRNVFLKLVYHRLWGRDLLDGASAVIATAERERAELIAGGIARNKIVLRRNGVEMPPESLPPRGTFRARMGIPAQAKLLLFLGRLASKKSPDLLLEAFASPEISGSASGREVHLVFVGPEEGSMMSKLQSVAQELGVHERVHFSQALQGAAKWSAYRDADIFVLPSQNENFGNTAAEAVAAGTPVIVTDQCGIAPLIKDRAAIVIEYDRAELTGALKELLYNAALYGKLQGGCASALESLGWNQPLVETEALYGKLVRPGDRKRHRK
jgi:glycosyltransferase involved in cell wall biosynthesis